MLNARQTFPNWSLWTLAALGHLLAAAVVVWWPTSRGPSAPDFYAVTGLLQPASPEPSEPEIANLEKLPEFPGGSWPLNESKPLPQIARPEPRWFLLPLAPPPGIDQLPPQPAGLESFHNR